MNKFILFVTITGFAAFAAPPNRGSPYQEVEKITKVPAPHTKASSGSQMFREYCASCHGQTGIGNGPAAPALKVTPPDLTALKAANNGEFPAMKVSAILRGVNDMNAHGSRDMPIWGPIFHSMDNNDSSLLELRIHNLTDYVKSIQK
jgi:mono/diheme cytochrome c family protein